MDPFQHCSLESLVLHITPCLFPYCRARSIVFLTRPEQSSTPALALPATVVLTGGEGGVEEHQGSIADPQDYLARPEMSPNGLAAAAANSALLGHGGVRARSAIAAARRRGSGGGRQRACSWSWRVRGAAALAVALAAASSSAAFMAAARARGREREGR